MGDLGPTLGSVLEGVDCKSCKCSPYHGQVSTEDGLNSRNTEFVETGLLWADIDISSNEDDLNALLLEGLENMHIRQHLCSSTCDKNIFHISRSNTSELLNLSKCETMPCSEGLQSCPKIFEKEEPSNIKLDYENSLSVRNASENAVSSHATSKLIPAIKGSRARHGKPIYLNLHVSWSAEVYDPPLTSTSHTMKGRRHHHHHHHRPAKAKKEYYKYKQVKTKPASTSSSRSSERRSSQRKTINNSILDPHMSRLQVFPNISLHAGFERPNIQQSEEDISFHTEKPPWPFCLSVTEAL